jgi:hypothetical protein
MAPGAIVVRFKSSAGLQMPFAAYHAPGVELEVLKQFSWKDGSKNVGKDISLFNDWNEALDAPYYVST